MQKKTRKINLILSTTESKNGIKVSYVVYVQSENMTR